ncbi:hypothetical protein EDD85DRAFT_38497 [Armillaria nabsnona]|nr:hypothetical protein EDD85DRAFT_38497 [Armillaria nabsnona]
MLKERSRSRSLGREKERRYYSSDDEAHVTRSRHQLRGEGSQRRHALPAKSPEGDRNTRGRDRHSKDISKRHRDSSRTSNRAEHEHRRRSRSSESYSSFSSEDHKKRRRSSRSRSPRRRKEKDSRKHKDRDYERDRKKGKSKEKDRKKDKDKEERRSVLTGKKIKLKVRKEKGDDEREANRKDLLQFLNSTFE